jgi:hypothetical protein
MNRALGIYVANMAVSFIQRGTMMTGWLSPSKQLDGPNLIVSFARCGTTFVLHLRCAVLMFDLLAVPGCPGNRQPRHISAGAASPAFSNFIKMGSRRNPTCPEGLGKITDEPPLD